eukprot:scaffold70_cov124-Skeletonema_dohrnii-CCMP3373.AAC.5
MSRHLVSSSIVHLQPRHKRGSASLCVERMSRYQVLLSFYVGISMMTKGYCRGLLRLPTVQYVPRPYGKFYMADAFVLGLLKK